jgi:hypothetical protein
MYSTQRLDKKQVVATRVDKGTVSLKLRQPLPQLKEME